MVKIQKHIKPYKIIEQVFKEEFGEDWQIELRDFKHGFPDFYICSLKAVGKALQIANKTNKANETD